MASSESNESDKRKSVSNLATRFERAAIESAKDKPNRETHGHADTTAESTEKEVVCATFEKKVGDTLDFKFYFGRNSRGTTGLFIRSVRSQSSIEGIIKPDDQLVKINDQDIRNSESDAVSGILENLSGTVKVEVIRIKKLVKRQNCTKTKPPVPRPRKPISRESNDNSQSPEEHKSVEIVHKRDDLNSKMQLMKNNANSGMQQIEENANIDTNRQTIEKEEDNTKSDTKQLREQSTGLKPETRQSLNRKTEKHVEEENNYTITPETHGQIQEKSSETPPTQEEYKNMKPEMHQTQSDNNTNVEQFQEVNNNTQNVLGEDADINQLQEDDSDSMENPHLSQNFENNSRIQQLEEQISSKNTEIQRLLKEKNDMELSQRRLVDDNSNSRAIIKVILEDHGIQLSPDEIARNTKVQSLQQENTNINMQKRRLEDEMQRLQQQNSSIVNENEILQKENIDKDNQIENLQQEIDNQKNEIQQLRQENSRIEQFQQENDNKDNEIRNLQQENGNKNNEIRQLRQENSRIEQFQQENDNKDNEIRNLQQENDSKNNEIHQLRQENSGKNNRIEHLQKDNEIKDNENQQLRQEIKEKNIAIQRHEQDVANKNKEILRLRQVIENSNKFAEKGSVVVSNEELGRGGYGAVYKGDFYGTKVAVKEYYQVILSSYNRSVLAREINMASQCRHPNLLQFISALENDKHHLLIVTELLDMALRTLIEQRAEAQSLFSYQEVQSISLDVARGLNYLHSKKPHPIIHRDISSANVLLSIVNDVVVRAKISDYGSANFMQLCNTKNPGAAIYAAPEAGSSQQDPKLDVFSYGILVCEMSICAMPDPMNRMDQIDQISHIGIRELVNNCTRDKSEERPNMHNVIKTWQNMKME